jgi:hypothetical protein
MYSDKREIDPFQEEGVQGTEGKRYTRRGLMSVSCGTFIREASQGQPDMYSERHHVDTK